MNAPAATPARAARNGDWRVEHEGIHGMYYEEFVDGQWQRLTLQSELCSGPAHHLVLLSPAASWKQYPAWARERRDEIIARIRWSCGSGYEFHEL